jgi:hypothetical protein
LRTKKNIQACANSNKGESTKTQKQLEFTIATETQSTGPVGLNDSKVFWINFWRWVVFGGGWFFCLWLQSAIDFVYIAIVGWFANYLG